MKNFQVKLEKLLAEAQSSPMKQSRAWLRATQHPKRGSIEIYIRVGMRYTQGSLKPVITLASIEARPTGTGLFTALLGVVETCAKANGLGVYVENVLTNQFAEFWRKRGYDEEDPSGCGVPCFRKWGNYLPALSTTQGETQVKKLTASDRTALIKMASVMPKGDSTRRAILAGLQGKTAADPKPDPKGTFDVYVEGQGSMFSPKKVFSKKKLSDVEKLLKKFEADFEKYTEIDPDDEVKQEKALKKMEPFFEGCDVTIKDPEGNTWASVGDDWEFQD